MAEAQAERRRYPRAPLMQLVRVRRLEEVQAFIASDISQGGIFLEGCPAVSGEKVEVELEVEDLRSLRLAATVEVVRKTGAGVGTKFVAFREGKAVLPRLVQYLLDPRVAKEILVVDTSDADRRSLTTMLRGLASLKLTEARSAAEALGLMGQRTFDAVITDLSMPEMDGFAFIQKVRAVEGSSRNMPFVVASGSEDERELERAFALGVVALLHKPIKHPDLVFAVCRAVGAPPV